MTTIYIDESGHSGDMVNSGNGYDFKERLPKKTQLKPAPSCLSLKDRQLNWMRT